MDPELEACLDRKFDGIGSHFELLEVRVGDRIDRVERRLEGVERRLESVEERLENVEQRLESVERRGWRT